MIINNSIMEILKIYNSHIRISEELSLRAKDEIIRLYYTNPEGYLDYFILTPLAF